VVVSERRNSPEKPLRQGKTGEDLSMWEIKENMGAHGESRSICPWKLSKEREGDSAPSL